MIESHEEVTPRTGWWLMIKNCSGTEADRRNQYWFLVWCVVWGLTYTAANWLLKSNAAPTGVMAWAVALVPIVFSIGALFSYLHFLRSTDELLRRIQVEGLALGFGVGVMLALAYPLLERLGAPILDVNDIVAIMMVSWALGQLLAMRRYR